MCSKIIIGSTALKHWFPDLKREPSDLDYAVPLGERSYRVIEYLYNPVLFKENYQHLVVDNYLIPDALYTLKMSHMFWDIQFNKHIYDIQFMKDKGCKVIRELFYDLYAFWSEYHGKNKRSELQMSAEEFFDNSVGCEHDHDFLHTLLVNPPTFTKILIGDVEVSEEKFELLSYEEKISLVEEEIFIMAAERGKGMSYRKRYEIMLKAFIQKHCPLWEAIFILDNFKELYKPRYDYIRKLNSKLEKLGLNILE